MSNQRYKPEHDIMLPPGELLELGVPSFHNESGNYWFRLQTVYLPDQPSEPAYTLILYRTYEDFYDFQIMLLDTFPTEAGRPADPEHSPPERLLPFMPGPVEEAIDDELTEYRRSELDAYVRSLLDLRNKGVGYVLRDELVRTFFAAKYGDFWEVSPRPENVEHLADRMAGVGIKPMPGQHARNAPEHSGGGNGWTFPTASGGPGERGDPYQQAVAAQHTRNVSSTGSNNINNLSVNTQNANSQHQQWSNNPSHNKHGPDGYNSALSAVTPVLPTLSQAAPAPPVPMHHNSKSLQAPPRPDAAFVKIKIYDRATDDIIALRVHPAVTYVELLDKVRARLGGSISVLQYRVGGGGGGGAGSGPTRQIRDDRDLGEWMASEDQRLMLYAEQA
jgi:bud emergence protein 1